MLRKYLQLPLLVIIVSSCGGSGSEQAMNSNPLTTPQNTSPLPDHQTILDAVYNPEYSVPDNFFVDERATTARSYSLHHVKDSSQSFEICSNSLETARDAESTDNANRAVQGQFVGSYENSRYFEFIRELAYTDSVGNVGSLTSPSFARIFKCNTVDRNGVDRNLRTGYAGRMNPANISIDSVKEFTQYLWQFTYFDGNTKKVISTASSESSNTIDHTLYIALHERGTDTTCDTIKVINWTFTTNRDSGEMQKRWTPIETLQARLSEGLPTLCP